jgi:hypothetical protein
MRIPQRLGQDGLHGATDRPPMNNPTGYRRLQRIVRLAACQQGRRTVARCRGAWTASRPPPSGGGDRKLSVAAAIFSAVALAGRGGRGRGTRSP